MLENFTFPQLEKKFSIFSKLEHHTITAILSVIHLITSFLGVGWEWKV